jgi:hypothetical protein
MHWTWTRYAESELAVTERPKPVIAGFFARQNARHAPGGSNDHAKSSTAEISSLAGNRSRSSRAGRDWVSNLLTPLDVGVAVCPGQ